MRKHLIGTSATLSLYHSLSARKLMIADCHITHRKSKCFIAWRKSHWSSRCTYLGSATPTVAQQWVTVFVGALLTKLMSIGDLPCSSSRHAKNVSITLLQYKFNCRHGNLYILYICIYAGLNSWSCSKSTLPSFDSRQTSSSRAVGNIQTFSLPQNMFFILHSKFLIYNKENNSTCSCNQQHTVANISHINWIIIAFISIYLLFGHDWLGRAPYTQVGACCLCNQTHGRKLMKWDHAATAAAHCFVYNILFYINRELVALTVDADGWSFKSNLVLL